MFNISTNKILPPFSLQYKFYFYRWEEKFQNLNDVVIYSCTNIFMYFSLMYVSIFLNVFFFDFCTVCLFLGKVIIK